MRISMRSTFKHRRIEIFIERLSDETFAFGFTLRGQEVRGTARTRLPGIARKRAQIALDRKLRGLRAAANRET
jgi:hypothetical protein